MVKNKSQFVIVNRQFGYPMFAAETAIGWSDRLEDAYIYDHRDNPEFKLKYWRAMASNNGLDSSAVQVEAL